MLRFPASFFGALVLAAVPQFFALSQGDFDLGDTVTEINPQGNDGQTFGIGTAGEFMDFAAMQEEFAFTEGLVIPRAARHVLSDVGINEEGAGRLEVNVSITNIGFSFAKSFHLGAVQHEAGFELLKYVVIVGGGTVLRDDLFAGFLGIFAALVWAFGWLGHNLSFYPMPRLKTESPRM